MEAPDARLAGSLAAALAGVQAGAAALRVHDVAETVQALKVWTAIAARPPLDARRTAGAFAVAPGYSTS